MSVKHHKAEEYYEVTIRLTPEEYDDINRRAIWEYGGNVSGYLRWLGLGNRRKGC